MRQSVALAVVEAQNEIDTQHDEKGGFKKLYGEHLVRDIRVVEIDSEEGIGTDTEAAPREKASDAAERVPDGDAGRTDLKDRRQVVEMLAIFHAKTAIYKIEREKGKRSANESAVEGRARGGREDRICKFAVPDAVVDPLHDDGRGIADKKGKGNADENAVL